MKMRSSAHCPGRHLVVKFFFVIEIIYFNKESKPRTVRVHHMVFHGNSCPGSAIGYPVAPAAAYQFGSTCDAMVLSCIILMSFISIWKATLTENKMTEVYQELLVDVTN